MRVLLALALVVLGSGAWAQTPPAALSQRVCGRSTMLDEVAKHRDELTACLEQSRAEGPVVQGVVVLNFLVDRTRFVDVRIEKEPTPNSAFGRCALTVFRAIAYEPLTGSCDQRFSMPLKVGPRPAREPRPYPVVTVAKGDIDFGFGRFDSCVREALRANPPVKPGVLKVEFRELPSGRLTGFKALATPENGAHFSDCVVGSLERVQFDWPPGTVLPEKNSVEIELSQLALDTIRASSDK